MYSTPAVALTAKKTHRCTSCGELIKPGTRYMRWVSFDDSAVTNKMHPECLCMHLADAEGEFEYELYGHERPQIDEARETRTEER